MYQSSQHDDPPSQRNTPSTTPISSIAHSNFASFRPTLQISHGAAERTTDSTPGSGISPRDVRGRLPDVEQSFSAMPQILHSREMPPPFSAKSPATTNFPQPVKQPSARANGPLSISSLVTPDSVSTIRRSPNVQSAHVSPTYETSSLDYAPRHRSASMRSYDMSRINDFRPQHRSNSHDPQPMSQILHPNSAPVPHAPQMLDPPFRQYQSTPASATVDQSYHYHHHQQLGHQSYPPSRPASQPVEASGARRSERQSLDAPPVHAKSASEHGIQRDFDGTTAPEPRKIAYDPVHGAAASNHTALSRSFDHGSAVRQALAISTEISRAATTTPREAYHHLVNHDGPNDTSISARASPMPPSVHGISSRSQVSTRDPSIKNEFGRMFIGLGSGVGGSTTPTAGTPTRRSPAPGYRQQGGVVVDEIGSAFQKPPRNQPSDTVMTDDVDGALDGRITPTESHSGNKRQKTAHHHHLHHHHQHQHPHVPIPQSRFDQTQPDKPRHHHHHHHHHHVAPEVQNIIRSSAPLSATSEKAPGVPLTGAAAHHHHHHHHHHHTAPHHHRHQQSKLPSPSLAIIDKDVLAYISNKHRHHLGTSLYTSSVSLKSSKRILYDFTKAFNTTPTPLPLDLQGKENCTLTIRVPRAYIRSSDAPASKEVLAGGLLAICRRRALWGTDVYTDDSDVVAAAIHSGWLAPDFGEWAADYKTLFPDRGPEVPVSGADDGGPATTDSSVPPMTELSSKPDRPVAIPRDREAHITVLILPALDNYASTSRNGMLSRAWGRDHDGVSFRVLGIKFVDEPFASRGAARGAVERKERLRVRCAERAVVLGDVPGIAGVAGGKRSVEAL